MIIADLQIHSRFSRACSKDITIANLEKYARIKGLDLLGTADFQHPIWFKEITNNLEEDYEGILWSKNKFPFLWQSEISLMFSKNGRRAVHLLMYAPGKEVAKQIIDALGKKGRLDYDGRPIFGMQPEEFVDMMIAIDKEIEIIPAHCMTPWFGIFGSDSGFNSVEECFGDRSKYIHALETGMSADPEMLWRNDDWNKFNFVSFSDAHSFWPWRMGREATLFDCELSYKNILKGFRTGKGVHSTLEVDPNYGKYHFDGHRNCNVVFNPEESLKRDNKCPKCGNKITIGVLQRVEKLSNHPLGHKPGNWKPFKKILPLHELIAAVNGISQMSSVKVNSVYNELIKNFGNEFNVLLNADEDELKKIVHEKIAKVIIKNRNGQLKVKAGYDGVYGQVLLNEDEKVLSQKKLLDY
ncbi:MAG TPA: endonuclease Q family protein [Candidatus Nanoarchaeia archaeon]|nr:endonuclease Q family protein [Candidatus Nanoarchaeia archaeon]